MVEDKKEEKKIKIAGWEFTPKRIALILMIIGIVILFSWISDQKEKKEVADEIARKKEEMNAAIENMSTSTVDNSNRDYLQESLVAKYGTPPDGFKWGVTGNLVPIGTEESSEDVVYIFLRALSVMDFSIAEKYALNSSVIEGYKGYYSVVSQGITNYYDNFLRKQYGESLMSLSVDGIVNTAVFADGTVYVTVEVSCLDLTNKDFWEKDRDALFDQMRIYRDTESDNTKCRQYVYDYIYDCYKDGKVGKKSYTIQLVCDKNYGGGWLVSNDKELSAVLMYENGVDVAQFIINEFETWYLDVTLKEKMNRG